MRCLCDQLELQSPAVELSRHRATSSDNPHERSRPLDIEITVAICDSGYTQTADRRSQRRPPFSVQGQIARVGK